MKLSKHQKEIVDKIISGEVYNIYSYLKAFNKGYTAKYNIEELRKEFEQSENGKTYKVMKEGHSTLQSVPQQMQTPMGSFTSISVPMPRSRKSIADDEWEEKPAEFIVDISLENVGFNQQTYTFDFKDKGVFVAKDFVSIIDVITLWTYLKQQSLIIEVSKCIKAEDIGVFYQLQPLVNENETSQVKWTSNFEIVEQSALSDFFCHDIQNETIKKKATSYMKEKWTLNEDHEAMCSDFLGKRIIGNTALRVFSNSGYKTENEKSQRNSMAVALIAVILSLISVLAGNILPLFQPNESDYLNAISEQLSLIQTDIVSFHENDGAKEIERSLDDISAILSKMAESEQKFQDDTNEKVDAIYKMLSDRK